MGNKLHILVLHFSRDTIAKQVLCKDLEQYYICTAVLVDFWNENKKNWINRARFLPCVGFY